MKIPRFSLSGMVLGTSMLAASICGAIGLAEAETIWPTRQWQTSTPEEQGMDSAALAGLVKFGTSRSFDSLLIARHGKIVVDAYYAPYSADIPHAINSATKSVISTLVAIAVRDGLLDNPGHRALDFFGDRGLPDFDDKRKQITVQDLLDMTAGIDWREPLDGRPDTFIDMLRSPDWIRFILRRPMSGTPGEIFNYNSGNSHLLSAIITRLTRMSALDYAKAKLFAPLGISTADWPHDSQGISTGGYGLSLLPRDMAKFGYLYLHKGEWEDKPLVPPAWIDRVSHASINMNLGVDPALRYSNAFWAFPDKQAYMAVGSRCQIILVLPAVDIVAVTTARDFCPFSRLVDLISGAVKSGTSLAPNPDGSNLLAAAIRDISDERPAEAGVTPEIAAAVSGKTYTFPENSLNLKSLSLTLLDPQPHYGVETYRQDWTRPPLKLGGPIGLDGRYRKSEPTAFGVTAARGKWLDRHTFVIESQTVGVGEGQKWTLSFEGEKLRLLAKDRAGRDVSIDGEPGG